MPIGYTASPEDIPGHRHGSQVPPHVIQDGRQRGDHSPAGHRLRVDVRAPSVSYCVFPVSQD